LITVWLSVIALVSATAVTQVRPTEDDWGWLDKYGETALDKVMPVGDSVGTTVTFRSYRDLYVDVAERYFRVVRDVRNDTITAVVVRPDGKSLQQQLLDLHLADRTKNVDELLQQLKFKSSELTDVECPALRKQMAALAELKFVPPSSNSIILHPVVYRIVIRFATGSVDATLAEDENPLVDWALKTADAFRGCIERRLR
jgi:hypothetical protein